MYRTSWLKSKKWNKPSPRDDQSETLHRPGAKRPFLVSTGKAGILIPGTSAITQPAAGGGILSIPISPSTALLQRQGGLPQHHQDGNTRHQQGRLSYSFLLPFPLWQDWGPNSGLQACKVDAIALESHHQSSYILNNHPVISTSTDPAVRFVYFPKEPGSEAVDLESRAALMSFMNHHAGL
jgi:hypothetical protein